MLIAAYNPRVTDSCLQVLATIENSRAAITTYRKDKAAGMPPPPPLVVVLECWLTYRRAPGRPRSNTTDHQLHAMTLAVLSSKETKTRVGLIWDRFRFHASRVTLPSTQLCAVLCVAPAVTAR